MLPGKSYTPDDLLALLIRYRWYLIAPAVVCGFLALLVSRFLPNTYESHAVLQVIPSRVPAGYIQQTVTMRAEQRLQAIQQQLRSRPKMEELVKEQHLSVGGEQQVEHQALALSAGERGRGPVADFAESGASDAPAGRVPPAFELVAAEL